MPLHIADADISDDRRVLSLQVYAPTLGWKNVALSTVVYVMPPRDGIQDVILSGTPPSGVALQQIEVFPLSVALPDVEWIKGARVRDQEGRSLLVLRTLERDARPIGSDPTFIESSGLAGDRLLLDVRYGGGCAEHDFQLSWDGAILKSNPPQVVLTLSHDAHGDPCRALLAERLQFDLSALGEPARFLIRVAAEGTEVVAQTPTVTG